jgi:hypothetical protein
VRPKPLSALRPHLFFTTLQVKFNPKGFHNYIPFILNSVLLKKPVSQEKCKSITLQRIEHLKCTDDDSQERNILITGLPAVACARQPLRWPSKIPSPGIHNLCNLTSLSMARLTNLLLVKRIRLQWLDVTSHFRSLKNWPTSWISLVLFLASLVLGKPAAVL